MPRKHRADPSAGCTLELAIIRPAKRLPLPADAAAPRRVLPKPNRGNVRTMQKRKST